MLEFTCPTCGKRVQGDDAIAGQAVLCPSCNIAMTTPPATARTATPTTAIATPEHAPQVKITAHTTSSDGSFREGLPPLDPSLPPLRQATSHILSQLAPYVVVASIVSILAACLIPAVQKVREASARTQSTSNLKHIGLAMHTFHDWTKRLPFNGTVPAVGDDPTSGSWAFQILVGMDSSPFFHQAKPNIGVSAYMCPGRGRSGISMTGAWSDYCINPFLNDPNGVVNAPDRKFSMKQITDGESNTIFVGHGSIDPDLYSWEVAIPQSSDILKGGLPATARRSTTNHRDKRGDASLTWGSPFPQGSLFVWCDGTVRFMSYSLTGGTIRNGVADGGLGVFLTPSGGERAVIPD